MSAGTHQGLDLNSRGIGAVYLPLLVWAPADDDRLAGPPLGVTRPGVSLVFLGMTQL
jgi:hypothetical protein